MGTALIKAHLKDSLLDEAPCGFIIFNDEGEIIVANKTIASMLSNTQDELTGKKFDTLLTIAGKIFYQTHFFPLIRLHEKAEEIFLTLVAADKTEVAVLVNAKRIIKKDVYENHCIMIPVPQRQKYEAELITAKKSLEHSLHRNELLQQIADELEQHKVTLDKQVTKLSNLNKDLVQFSNVISHDIQEPIRKIAMFADIIFREDHAKLSDISKISIDKIKLATGRTRDLITCLQQYVSVDTVPTSMTECDLKEIIGRARLKVIIDTQFQDIELSCNNIPKIDGHSNQLELLFYHLILNAQQFRKEGEKTIINIEADIIQENSFQTIEGKYRYIDFVRLRLSDAGIGFNNKYQEYIFHLFKKAHATTAGLGFGLALCKKIVENHFGSISALSHKKGTTFTILLPCRQQHTA